MEEMTLVIQIIVIALAVFLGLTIQLCGIAKQLDDIKARCEAAAKGESK